jgi:gliding motility-associated-like protein
MVFSRFGSFQFGSLFTMRFSALFVFCKALKKRALPEMSKYFLAVFLSMFASLLIRAQDFSNKGKDFWIGYGNHVRMFGNNAPERMQLYITSDVTTTGNVAINSIGFNQPFTVVANQITTIDIPRSAALLDQGIYNHGIHVTAEKPIVVYSFIYVNAISGATVCLPTNTLGREYYSLNYSQLSNEANSFSYFFVVATDTGTTTVEITPSAETKANQQPNVPFTVNLTQGQIYQVLGRLNTTTAGVDLTGSKIRSISQGGSCKKIAVFCGSGKISIGCNNAGSSDNLYQQMYPTSTWGKKFITVPGLVNTTNIFRIVKSDPSAFIRLNGATIPPGNFINNFYYEFSSSQVNVIESDKPIMVAQYFTTQSCLGNVGNSDPEMVYLNPVEQTISSVTLNSMQPFSNTNINSHFLNVVIKNNPGSINSFKIDGSNFTSFTPVPGDPSFATARIQTTQGTHNVVSDSGFNIIAYGFGNAESYGYSGGTNLRDLYQFLTLQNGEATVNFPSGCRNTPFKFSITLPYKPNSLQWKFNGLFNDTTINNPQFDSSWTVNDRILYRFPLNRVYVIPNTGNYPIKILADNPTPDGCSGQQEIDYDLQIFESPKAHIKFTHSGCITDPVQFRDSSIAFGRTLIAWKWDFDDGTFSNQRNPTKSFTQAKSFNVKMVSVSDIGCVSDTARETIIISNPPTAIFTVSNAKCENKATVFTDQSTPAASLAKWYWDFGNGNNVVATNGNPVTQTYATAGTYTVRLTVESQSGCKSLVTPQTIVVTPNPKVDFDLPGNVCLPSGAASFVNRTTIADNSLPQVTYNWTFGDGNGSTATSPTHAYTTGGPFTVWLRATSKDFCVDSLSKQLTTIFPAPTANFDLSPELCLGTAATFTDRSTASTGAAVSQWRWTFGDGNTATVQNPAHTYGAAGPFSVGLQVITDKGCSSSVVSKPILINALPRAVMQIVAPTCATQTVSFNDRSVANAGVLNKWNWNFGNSSTSTQQNATSVYPNTGNYWVTLSVETDKGCKSLPDSQQIKINPLPVPKFGMPEICLDDPNAQFTDSSTIADNSQAQFTYAWNFGDPNANAGNPNTSTLKNPLHRYNASGVYNVRLSVTSKDGCTKDTTQAFTVNGAKPKATFTVNNTGVICSNKTVTITNNSTVDFGTVTQLEIYWDYQADPTKKTVDPVPQAGKTYTYQYPDFGSPATKTFEIRVIAYSGISCQNQESRTITVTASPKVQFNPMPAVCEELTPFQITQARDINNLAGTPVYTGNGVSSSGIFSPAVAKPGTHTIVYQFNAANGCTSIDSQRITVHPSPVVNAGPDRSLLDGGNVQLLATATGAGLTYAWTPTTNVDNPTSLQPRVSPLDDITYTLTAVTTNNCRASDAVFVRVLKDLKVPNAFSPNGDGIFDRWLIEYLDSYPGAVVEVFNRYGQQVYRSENYDARGWDGTMNGKPLPIGTYYYIINPKNGRKQIQGSVTIIR